MSVAEREIAGVSASHCTVCEFRSGMWEDTVPPVEETGWITGW